MQAYPNPEIKQCTAKKLCGISCQMSMQENKTGRLWGEMMGRRNTIANRLDQNFISLQHYPENYFDNFNPQTPFEKWACVEVTNFDTIPGGMEGFELETGLYAVFTYRGSASGASTFFNYIFNVWFPESDYLLDKRPHFEILGEKYKQGAEDSEEEVWIPIKVK